MRGSDLTGQMLDRRYKIEERISEGAMGVVYRAKRLKLDRAVAVKVMHASLQAEDGRKRFEREAKLMAKLEHPHCVSIIDYGLHETQPYVVMELIRGRDLHEMLVEAGRFDKERAVEILSQVLSGLAHAHDLGIVHRDIKPANIMMTPKAPLGVHVRLLDFGLAKMLGQSTSLSDGVAVGTPSYMAPEQCRGDQLDQRVDIYACGVVLFEMLTGKKPFRASSPLEVIKKQIQEEPPRLADIVPGDYGELEAVVAKALAKSPADRYQSASAMTEAIKSAVKAKPVADANDSTRQMSAPSVVERKREKSEVMKPARSSAGWIVLGMLVVGGAGAAGFYYYQYERDRERAAAQPVPADAAPLATVELPKPVDATTPPDPVRDIVVAAVANTDVNNAIETLNAAKKLYPNRAEIPAAAGKLFFGKMWWNDGIANFREAIKIDPTLKSDPEIVQAAVKGFMTTPAWDGRLSKFLEDLGDSAVPLLDDLATNHANPAKRARAQSMRQRLKR